MSKIGFNRNGSKCILKELSFYSLLHKSGWKWVGLPGSPVVALSLCHEALCAIPVMLNKTEEK
jgi:hypothetical protein